MSNFSSAKMRLAQLFLLALFVMSAKPTQAIRKDHLLNIESSVQSATATAPARTPTIPYPGIQCKPTLHYELIYTTTPDNSRFNTEIGHTYAYEMLQRASEFVLATFNQKFGEDSLYVEVILTVESFTTSSVRSYPLEVSATEGNIIRINADHLQHYVGDVKTEFTGVLYHESTRVWESNGNGSVPDGLRSGIADFVRLKSGWASESWPKRGSGQRWEEGYAVTAYFLEYCSGLREGFIASLNAMMKDTYSDEFFLELLGKNVDELWSDYKAAYEIYPPAWAALAPTPTAAPPYSV